MASSRRSFSRGSSRRASTKDWIGLRNSTNVTGLSAFWVLTPQQSAVFKDPTVLMTWSLSSFVSSGIAGAAGTYTGFGVGIIVASGDPDSATVPSEFADPITDPQADWILRQMYPLEPGAAAGRVLTANDEYFVTSKARRKIPIGSGILVCYQIAGVPTYAGNHDIRCLLQSS